MDQPNKNVDPRGGHARAGWSRSPRACSPSAATRTPRSRRYCRRPGVSRGSLYHHFASKEALFEAVAEDVEDQVGAQTVAAAAGTAGPVAALRAGFLAWIRLAGDPVVQRILLIDAPSVLGWERWRAMEERHALGLIRAVLQSVADEGSLRPELVDTLAHVLLASVNEVALLVARSDDPQAAMTAGADTIDELLRRLLG